ADTAADVTRVGYVARAPSPVELQQSSNDQKKAATRIAAFSFLHEPDRTAFGPPIYCTLVISTPSPFAGYDAPITEISRRLRWRAQYQGFLSAGYEPLFRHWRARSCLLMPLWASARPPSPRRRATFPSCPSTIAPTFRES